jgi:hypothetical protein
MALLVMAKKAYGELAKADYPNLAGKAKFGGNSSLGSWASSY